MTWKEVEDEKMLNAMITFVQLLDIWEPEVSGKNMATLQNRKVPIKLIYF